MREEFEKKLKKSKENPETPELVVTKSTTRESSQLTFWLFIDGNLTPCYMDEPSVKVDDNGQVSGIVRCSNRFNKAIQGCKFAIRLLFRGPIHEFTENNKMKSENWDFGPFGVHGHKLIDAVGRETLAKTKKSKKCCNYSIGTALKKVFHSHLCKLTGKRDNPAEDARNLVLNGESWSVEKIAETFDMRSAKRNRRRIEKIIGINEKFIIPSYLHFVHDRQIHWPMFRTNEKGESIEDRQNLYYCNKDWLHHLEEATSLFIDCTFRACKATEYKQVMIIGKVHYFEIRMSRI